MQILLLDFTRGVAVQILLLDFTRGVLVQILLFDFTRGVQVQMLLLNYSQLEIIFLNCLLKILTFILSARQSVGSIYVRTCLQ